MGNSLIVADMSKYFSGSAELHPNYWELVCQENADTVAQKYRALFIFYSGHVSAATNPFKLNNQKI
jgi:hypothetical protein